MISRIPERRKKEFNTSKDIIRLGGREWVRVTTAPRYWISHLGEVYSTVRKGRVLKQTLDKVMANKDVKGARIAVSGRLGGAEMSRREQVKKGMLPLQTFRADVDFARERAILPYGTIGVKVWIYRGEIFENK